MDQPCSKCQTVWGAVVYTFKVQKNHQEVYIKCGYTEFAHWPNKWHPQHRWWRPPARNRSQLRCETDDDMYQRRSTYDTQSYFNPLTPTVAIWVQLYSILCQTGLSRHLYVLTSGHTLMLRAERQSAQMSKRTDDGLARSGTGCCTHMATVGVKGLNRSTNIIIRDRL